ncbi:hypothetical protein B296_00029129 [Ensete ventricosum]|uniref:Uncharacterized protein n=1 Tax=Ensete ventricosum TaxID=4639 RepID=A0A426Z182_ENSVE|nr:hypothetical protein B296_00029129 [Ensete ventricosum]
MLSNILSCFLQFADNTCVQLTFKVYPKWWDDCYCKSSEQVIAGVMNFLRLRIPPYIRIDFAQLKDHKDLVSSQAPLGVWAVVWLKNSRSARHLAGGVS